MVDITINEAKEQLINAYPGLYADFVSGLHEKEILSKSSAYKSHNTIVVKTLWCDSEQYIWYICDIGNSDMDLALTELAEKDENNLDKIMIYARECEGIHCLIFSCIGEPYNDADIRCLSENDSERVLSLTTVLDDDNKFSKSISHGLYMGFLDMKHDLSIHTLGIFVDASLAGAISIKNKNNNQVIVVNSIFISNKYRGCGYASRLIRAAMAMYPGAIYSYSCGSDNCPSIASAKSAGFVFEGTYIF